MRNMQKVFYGTPEGRSSGGGVSITFFLYENLDGSLKPGETPLFSTDRHRIPLLDLPLTEL